VDVTTRILAAASERSLDTAGFKHAARRFASGVTVVTTRVDDELHGGTVSAFFTLSLEPLQIIVSLNRSGRLASLICKSSFFAVNILAFEQEALARLFASPERPTARGAFPGVTTDTHATGSPVIRGCLAYFDCSVANAIDSGDHTLFVGQVHSVGASEGQPLLYFDGAYRSLAPLTQDPV
jgi:flavin reductase (DIM6/NTAB) family NADH-FMN oxidoreductase RutF